ncbi:MAG TPA: NIPSNAP family protein [Steroidobacteraceae bacterium]|nr:NIPSNAP family protein [Steroidobacteraceae bacterium]
MPRDTVLELRQYTLRGGQRDTLISMFERQFLEPLNAVGARVLGTFRDLDDPDRFVWIRGFDDMIARKTALAAFYEGPIWIAHRTAANATIVDSDNVLLLRPESPGEGFKSAGEVAGDESIIGANIYYLGDVEPSQFATFFEHNVLPRLSAAGIRPIATLVSEESTNNYPRLPIRERDRAFIWFTRWANVAAEEAFAGRFSTWSGWRDSAPESVLPALMRKPERLRLMPTTRSVLR